MRLQGDGMAGEFFVDYWEPINNTQWVGGTSTQEDWVEIFPYVFAGYVPQAILLQDPVQLAVSEGWINTILARAQPNGWFGPMENLPGGMLYWPRWPIVLTFLAWHEYGTIVNGTGDERVLNASLAWCHIAYTNLTSNFPLDNTWGGYRWQDFILVAQALMDYPATPPSELAFLAALSAEVYKQGSAVVDWERDWYVPGKFPTTGVPSWDYEPHGVNNAMAVKSGALVWRAGLNPAGNVSSYARIALYDEYHGSPAGHFQADECLAGNAPSRGAETCLVAEEMFSLSLIHEAQGDAFFADREERIAYNSLPGALTKDLWARVYLQQPNELSAVQLDPHVWVTDGDLATVYSLGDNYFCCTTNWGQSWPRHIQHMLHMSKDGGLAVSKLGPVSAVIPALGGLAVNVSGEYPFEDDVTITLSGLPAGAITLPLYIRVPAWATAATISINGGAAIPVGASNGTMLSVPGLSAYEGPSLTILFATNPSIYVESWYNSSISIYRGALLYSLALGENLQIVKNYTGGARDYYITQPPDSNIPWNVAVVVPSADNPAGNMTFVRNGPVPAIPYASGQNPNAIMVPVRTLTNWPIIDNAAAPPPESPVDCSGGMGACGEIFMATFVPYGSTHLRMSSFPWTLAGSG
jgi:hypothetical protein